MPRRSTTVTVNYAVYAVLSYRAGELGVSVSALINDILRDSAKKIAFEFMGRVADVPEVLDRE